MTVFDLVPGEIYHLYEPGCGTMIVRFDRLNPDDVERPYGTYISDMMDKNWNYNPSKIFYFPRRNCMNASKDQADWLKECIRQGKLVPVDTVPDSNIEILKGIIKKLS